MIGFWTKTPSGHVVHTNGDPDMSEEIRFALGIMMDEAAKQFMACRHVDSQTIYGCNWGPHYTFEVQRCAQCLETTVRVLGHQPSGSLYLATLPTHIAPYHTGAPQYGYAYYWRFDGLSHSTPPIAPAPPSEMQT